MRQPPVKVGEELDVKIEAVGEKGDGIAKKDGFVLFVPAVHEGDEVRVRVTKVLNKVGFAESIGAAQSTPVVSQPKPRFEKKEYNKEEESEDEPEEKAQDTEDFGEEKTEKEEYKKEEVSEDADEDAEDDAEDEEIDQADQY
jgi:predicted RNA-binding protein with TRAM domain